VNDRIRSIAVVGMVLLAALIIGTTYWQAWAESQLSAQQDNALQRVAQFKIDRGDIKTEDGTVLALNHVLHVKGNTFYLRHYPVGPLAVAVVGYSTQGRSRAGLERSMNDFLTASNSDLNTVLTRTLNSLEGKTVRGNSLVLTLKLGPQFLAQKALAGSCGAAVALDVKTGKVLVMATSPTYNPNLVEHHFDQIAGTKAPCYGAPSPLLNRATAGLYQPGSSFKLVTAAAALDSGTFTPDSTFFDPGYCVEFGKQVHNFQDQSGPEVFGNVTLAQGLQHSINSVFCNVGKKLGALKILQYAKRFGFYSTPNLETPTDEQSTSGLYNCDRKTGRCRLFDPRHDYQVDPGRLAFGQERLQVTPLQMAMVAAAIGNGGAVMQPYVVDRILKPGGGVLQTTKPRELDRAISPRTASELTTMMESVVTGGTGTAAQIPGVAVAGKTGTAETGRNGVNTTWFVAFAPADHPRYAVAVTLENQLHKTGGEVAAPIAKTVLEALLKQKTP
jgi:peptidoglycan glycosyltransferase